MTTGQMAVRGKLAYGLYRAATLAAAPLIYLHLHWRRLRGLEHPTRWPERFGRPSSPRPPSPLLWFHAVSLGEGLAAIPVIKHCIGQHPDFVVLMTTTTASAFEVIKDQLPNGVIYQLAPLDFPLAVDAFLAYWKPIAVLLMESELWPNLIFSATEKGITVALLNARMSSRSFKHWSGPIALPLISFMLSKLSLIVPLSTVEAIRFQLLHASPCIINFAAVGDFDILEKEGMKIKDLQLQLAERPTWMAASLHKGEEEDMHALFLTSKSWTPKGCFTRSYLHVQELDVKENRHQERFLTKGRLTSRKVLDKGKNEKREFADFLEKGIRKQVLGESLIHSRVDHHWRVHNWVSCGNKSHIGQFKIVLEALKSRGVNVALRSRNEIISPSSNIYVVDTLGELRMLYRVTPVAVIGGSFLPGLAGHNLSEAAAAGCAVLTGPHIGHFSNMLAEMLQSDCLSVLQVGGNIELFEALKQLLGDVKALEARQEAARRAFSAVSNGVVHRVWNLVSTFVLKKTR